MHLVFVMSFFIQVVPSQDWPDVTNFAALAAVQANRQGWIHDDLFGVSAFSGPGARAGGMIMYDLIYAAFLYDLDVRPWFLNNFF
jgi:hypothetical protein